MRVSTFLKLAVVMAILISVALVAASKALDSARYQALLAERVRAASGLELSFSGPTKIKLGLRPQVSFTGLALSTRPNGPALAYVDRIEARVALIPLIFRSLQVESVSLFRPVVRLSALPARPGLLDLSQGADKAPPTRFAVSEVIVEDGMILWRPDGAAKDASIQLNRARFLAEGAGGGALNLQLTAKYRDTPLSLEGVVGSLAGFISGKPYPIQLKGTASGAVVVVRGHVNDPLMAPVPDLEINAQGTETTDFLKQSGLLDSQRPWPAIGPYKLAARMTEAGFPEVEAAFGKRDGLRLTLRGAARTLTPPSGLDMVVSAEAESIIDIARLLALDLPSAGPVKLTGRLGDAGGGWRLTGMKAAVGRSDFAGELALMQGPRPRLAGRLSSAALHLEDFSLPKSTASDSARVTPQRPSIPVMDERMLPLDPLPLDWLKSMDANLSLSATRLHLGGASLTDAGAELTLTGAKANIENFQAQSGEGRIKGEARLDLSGRLAVVAARLQGSGVELARLGEGFPLTSGKVELAVELKASGNSPRALAGSLDGSMTLGVSDAALTSVSQDLGRRLADTLDPPGAGPRAAPHLRCLWLRATARSGLVTLDKASAAETERTSLGAIGTIDLRNETIDLGFSARTGAWTRIKGVIGAPLLAQDGPQVRLSPDAAACRTATKSKR